MRNSDYTRQHAVTHRTRHRSPAPKWVAAAKDSLHNRPPPQRPSVATAAPATSTLPGTSRPQPPTASSPVYKPPRPPPLPSTKDRYRSEVIMAVQLAEPSIIPRRLRSSATTSVALRGLPPLPLPFRAAFPLPFPALRPRPACTELICPSALLGSSAAPVPCGMAELCPPSCPIPAGLGSCSAVSVLPASVVPALWSASSSLCRKLC